MSAWAGGPSALHPPSGWISWDRSDVPGERIKGSSFSPEGDGG